MAREGRRGRAGGRVTSEAPSGGRKEGRARIEARLPDGAASSRFEFQRERERDSE